MVVQGPFNKSLNAYKWRGQIMGRYLTFNLERPSSLTGIWLSIFGELLGRDALVDLLVHIIGGV
jgi:hypothetical protein